MTALSLPLAVHVALAIGAVALSPIAAAELLRAGPPRRHAVLGSAGVLVAAALSGVPLEATYRNHVRQRLFAATPTLGWLFERKIHLAFAAAAFGVAAACATIAAESLPAPDLRRTARLSAVAAAALTLFAATASLIARH